ncbi:UBX domain-containing protein 4 [Frankliniella fusca]|uniref:UBX domain-containing protein 4 n=1 Tax=Frankliniella fusca TaxID=407009 RepID=A0AAE1H2H0_9NEOP|nr:UBX domain-containing protein 4 [Frankliniella fusca]
MRWFEGDIAQAVTQSRARNAIFVVFVEGENETSERISEAVNNDAVSAKLEGSCFVSIHFKNRDPPVPSLYFIGRNGSPIEVVSEACDTKTLMQKIEHVENVHLGKTSVTPPTTSSASADRASSGTSDLTAASSSTPTAPLEDRVERAKELLEEKRMKKKKQEEEEARQKEMLRRKEGQNVQELKRWQQEQELKQLKEERLREKKMEQEARQRVLEQIAQDRAARNALHATASSASVAQQGSSTPTISSSNSNEARLQFRLPDGSTYSNRFEADATLAEVRQYVISNVALPFTNFSLATMFPRREFTSQDNTTTLRDLELVPSSVILVLPAGGRAVADQSAGFFGLAQTLLLVLTYPITQLYTFIRQFFSGPPSNGANAAATPTQSQNQGSNLQDKRSQRRSGGAYRRSGTSNVHRLHQNQSSSDDENNTWNGNSTQQM